MRRAALASVAGAWLVLAGAQSAFADDPLNSNNKPQHGDADDRGRAHDEFNIVPVAGGTTDIGIGGGYFAGLARMKPHYEPYEWNVESAGFLTFSTGADGKVVLPYQDIYVLLTVPRFLGSSGQLEVRPSYTWETTLNYYGLGNASSSVPPPGAPHDYFTYGRTHPQLDVLLRFRLRDHLAGRVSARYTQNWLQVDPGSRLAEDMRAGSDEVKKLLGSTDPHGVATFTYGLQWDSRDDNVSSHSGTFDQVAVVLSPGGIGMFPHRYAQGRASLSAFVPIQNPHLTLAMRVVGDAIIGNPPFYELARYEDTYALGGLSGVRGVPAQRYYGKVKAFGNVELRTELATFHALGKVVNFGVVGFFDAGRLWADTTPQPALDGTALGLKYGTGLGLRLRSGAAFVLRLDVAWSPDASPIGGYFSAGQAF